MNEHFSNANNAGDYCYFELQLELCIHFSLKQKLSALTHIAFIFSFVVSEIFEHESVMNSSLQKDDNDSKENSEKYPNWFIFSSLSANDSNNME